MGSIWAKNKLLTMFWCSSSHF